jgi:hypothetical protein
MVLYASPTFDGQIHDKKIADTDYRIPPGITLAQHTGYQGYRLEGVTVIQPVKKRDHGGTETGQPHNFFFQRQSGTCHREY